MDKESESLTEILVTTITDPQQLSNYSLLLSAVNIPHHIICNSAQEMEVYVAPNHLEKALYQIAAFTDENHNWPPTSAHTDAFAPAFRAMSVVVVGLLIYVYALSGDWSPTSIWFTHGAGDSEAILHKFEFYRLITPLTLHADLVHLMGNCFLGGLLLHFLFHLIGNGIGLSVMLLTATIANLINVMVHGPGHLFVGFSTAVFSVIGMLCTINVVTKTSRPIFHVFMSVMAGFALLAMLGSSGERTDLGAHLFGLLCGLLSGNLVRLPNYLTLRNSTLIQTLLVALSLGCILIAWYIAF